MSTPSDLATLIGESRRTVIFTGAGMSTESGVPDFRSPGGVWSRMKPIEFDDFRASRAVRKTAWDRVYANATGWVGAAPNDGHRAVATLLARGLAQTVITQNVDNLHQDAGTPPERVVELHGNASYARCLQCEERYELDALRPRWEAGEDLVCAACGGLIKTATLSFGQPLPRPILERAVEESRAADLFVVLGSSLVVRPAATLPVLAHEAGAELAIVNRDDTPLDGIADLRLRDGIGSVLGEALASLGLREGP